jgi:hypothetical protein
MTPASYSLTLMSDPTDHAHSSSHPTLDESVCGIKPVIRYWIDTVLDRNRRKRRGAVHENETCDYDLTDERTIEQ